MIEGYQKYLELIQNKIDGFFKQQEPFIFCKKGCSYCCENGEYPWSKMEFNYLVIGYNELDFKLKQEIAQNIISLKEQKKNFHGIGAFMHKCPFLINKTCAVYKYRGIVCRTFGLLSRKKDGQLTIPFCASMGLNYSNVYDMENHCISKEKCEKLNTNIEPLLYRTEYDFLTQERFSSAYGFEFGEKKPLLDWF